MSDYNSSLPVRTENDGDVVVKVGDATTPSQQLAIDAAGKVTVKLDDGAGNAITSQTNGAQQALDVGINVAGVQVDPRDVRALTAADVVTVDQGTSPWITKDVADGSVSGGTAGTFSQLAGGVYNTSLPTLTNGQQAALQTDATGKLLVSASVSSSDDHNFGTVGANTLRAAAQIGNATGAADFGAGAIGAQTLRTAAEISNASGLADFNNGATGAQTLRVAANLAVAGAAVTSLNPVPVTITNVSLGTEVNDYSTAASLAAAASSNHDYTITATKTFKGRMFWASASGKMKVEVQISADGTTFVTKWVGFNSTANPNIEISLDNLAVTESGTGSKIRIIRTNKDNQAQDVYSTISGTEV